MKNQVMVHGSASAIQKLIDKGKIKYPVTLWNTTNHTYGYLNENGVIEEIGIPKYIGTYENEVVLSELDDGIYRIQGQHRITSTDETVFLSASDIFVIVSTSDDVRHIRRITADEIGDYHVFNGEITFKDFVVTESYLKEQGYVDEATLDAKLIVLEALIKEDLKSYIDEHVQELVDQAIDVGIQNVGDDAIEDLFD